ncbi:unnamed protein product, partial [Prorocentrum cordatum]
AAQPGESGFSRSRSAMPSCALVSRWQGSVGTCRKEAAKAPSGAGLKAEAERLFQARAAAAAAAKAADNGPPPGFVTASHVHGQLLFAISLQYREPNVHVTFVDRKDSDSDLRRQVGAHSSEHPGLQCTMPFAHSHLE